ncbi:MAG: hypothetical protein ACI4MQ_06155 [Candidatus Coproplasma sp.]
MGTSSIFNGPIKNNPLLPPEYNEEPELDNEQENVEPQDQVNGSNNIAQVTWATVKSDFSKYINAKSSNSRGGVSLKTVARQYVRASGGAKSIISRAKAGISSGNALAVFFSSLNNIGLKQTLNDLHIQYSGKSVNELMSKLVNAISPNSVTKEDIVAKKATQDALSHVYAYIERNELDITCLDKMPQSLVDESMCSYLEAYIWGLMLKDLGSRIEKYESSPDKAEEIENELKGFTKAIVEVEFNKDKAIFQKSPVESVTVLMEKCLKAIEGIV